MRFKKLWTESTIAQYGRNIRATPREVIFNKNLLTTSVIFACCGIPICWDQGSSSVVPSLKGFQDHFGISSGSNAQEISNFISLVYIGCGVGSGLSFFINDRIGRLWSLRLYMTVWIVGQLVATFTPGMTGLYAARIISGLGIGPLTVLGPMTIVEIAPAEIRGLLASWFSVAMLLSLFVSTFCVYGVFLHIPTSRLQYQVVWSSPCVFIVLCITVSFLLSDSPRWLFLVDRNAEAIKALEALRGLPADHPFVCAEVQRIQESIAAERVQYNDTSYSPSLKSVLKEAFTVSSNLRRIQQAFVSYGLAQLSGANSVTAYLVPILSMMGLGGGTTQNLFLSGMYSMAKFFYTLIASFFIVDAFGRRKSLFIGITIQMLSDIYIGTFIKYKQEGSVSDAASKAAIAAIFIHGFGYAVGLLILPYVFAAELWPNRIRSLGTAMTQMFHWLFFYGVNKGTPSMLAQMNNWGAFIFFAAWCFISLIYVFFMVPEIAGLSLEEMDALFKGSWFNAYSVSNRREAVIIEAQAPKPPSEEP